MSPAPPHPSLWKITNLNIVSGNLLNLITWTAPNDLLGTVFQHSHIRRRIDTFPVTVDDGVFVANVSGSGNSYYVNTDLENNESYYYSLFSIYDSSSHGPYSVGPATPASENQFFNNILVTFSHLGTNTRLYSREQKFNVVDLIVWLPLGQVDRQTAMEAAFKNIKPAHTLLRIFWESYYVAQTTTVQFGLGSYDSDVYTIENGTIVNSVPTIDSSFSGDTTL